MTAILGFKQNMGAKFDRFGRRIPVTQISVEPNVVLSMEEGKIMLGLGKKKKAKKTENAFLKTAGFAPRFVREVKSDSTIPVGSQMTVSQFSEGDLVKITGSTKGRGFAGGIKRWGFHGGPKTHGQSDRHRAPGSIGQTTTPGRVFKGKKMAGHMGAAKKTIGGLEVVEVDEAKNLLIVKGAVPGAKNGFLVIEKIGKAKNYTPPPEPKEEPESQKEPKEELKVEQKAEEVKETAKEDAKEETKEAEDAAKPSK